MPRRSSRSGRSFDAAALVLLAARPALGSALVGRLVALAAPLALVREAWHVGAADAGAALRGLALLALLARLARGLPPGDSPG